MSKEHIHKFKRYRYKNGTSVYFCTNNCHFKIEVAVSLGKECLCNICGEPFVMNEYTIKLAKPHCSNCGKIKVKNPDGTATFQSKSRIGIIAKELAAKPVESLRDRLSQVVTMERDEDL